ncbi:TadE/TadG family type IV pilus assembly protein [Bradyrhizobium sp. RDM4]|uniref:TadE/TadG family type IV pilus assembly protein n=1 Tax=Bradyrhizobium sp. RDM4 TaxID=3378765 RepID=UPI0038FBFE41
MFTRSFATVWRDDEGSVLIEATILMPFLVTLMFGLFEFSWYFHKQQLVESGSAMPHATLRERPKTVRLPRTPAATLPSSPTQKILRSTARLPEARSVSRVGPPQI